MGQVDALIHFHDKYINPMLIEKIKAANQYFLENKDSLSEAFVDNFRQLCNYIITQQEQEKGSAVHSISLSLLRTSLNEGKALCRWDVFDANGRWEWQTDYHTYDITWAVHYLDEIIEKLEPERKKYVLRLIRHDLTCIKQTQIAFFFQYVKQLIYNVIRWHLTGMPEFQTMKKEVFFSLNVGEFLSNYKPLYICAGPSEDEPNMRSRLKRNPCQCYQSLRELRLLNCEYSNINFSYSDVGESNFINSKMGGMYVGTRLRNTNCIGSDFSNSIIFDADFSNSSLEQANFSYTKGGRGLGADILKMLQMLRECTQEDRKVNPANIPSFLGVCFYGCDLTETNFAGADLRGADFRTAVFADTNFEQCLLEGAIFLKQDLDKLQLTPEQIQAIDWVEE